MDLRGKAVPCRTDDFRGIHLEGGVVSVTASVSPRLRIPLFWLACKNYRYPFYLHLCRNVPENFGYLSLYFHPWEFTDVSGFGLPAYTVRGCGGWLLERLHRLVDELGREAEFVTMRSLIDTMTTR